MARLSAGILPYRLRNENNLEVFIVHPGGPLWTSRDQHSWSVAKGEVESGENPSQVAEREFAEEVGVPAPEGTRHYLGIIAQSGGKRVMAWAVEAPNFEVAEAKSNKFEIEWPPRSGIRKTFPEIDRAQWFHVSIARQKLLLSQSAFIDQLIRVLHGKGIKVIST